VPDLARVRAVSDVVDLADAREIDRALAPHPGMEQLVVDQHDVAVHPHLVRMGVRRQRHLADDARSARVLDIDDRGALRRVHVTDKGNGRPRRRPGRRPECRAWRDGEAARPGGVSPDNVDKPTIASEGHVPQPSCIRWIIVKT
jgi:hypothetical protein